MSHWSAQQAQWLRALGYRVLVRREADWPASAVQPARPGPVASAPSPAPSHSPATPVEAPPAAVPMSRRVPAKPALEAAPRIDPAPPAPRTDASAKLVALTEARRERAFSQPRYAALLAQVMRAAGVEGAGGVERLRMLGVDLPDLQRNPAAKRALWPRLRALRRESRQ